MKSEPIGAAHAIPALVLRVAVTLTLVLCSLPQTATSAHASTRAPLTTPSTLSQSVKRVLPAQSSPRQLAARRVRARTGGTVRSKSGFSIKVPPNAMQKDGRVTIREVQPGVYDFHIGVPWTGSVRVSMPAGRRLLIAHQYADGQWAIESVKAGQKTVSVQHLSLFKFIDKQVVKWIAECGLNGTWAGFSKCALKLTIRYIPKALLSDELKKIVNDCNFVTGWIDLLASCPAGETPEDRPSPAPATPVTPSAPVTPPVPVSTPAGLPPLGQPDRFAIRSYDQLAPGAANAEWFQAWQGFTAMSNTLTRLAINVGDARWAPGPVPATATLRLCRDANCAEQIGAWSAQIVNFGTTSVDVGDVAVDLGATYFLRYDRPDALHSWRVYFWGPGDYNTLSCSITGYNR